MELRDNKNITSYGFFLFLILAGVLSIIGINDTIRKGINSMSIPVFLLSLAIVLSKANSFIRDNAFMEIDKTDMKLHNSRSHDYSIDSLKDLNAYVLMVKRVDHIDKATKVINTIAIICFAICPLTMMGIIPFPADCGYINVFSLALVYFDFCILDDVLRKIVRISKDRILEEAKQKAKKQIDDNKLEVE